MNKPVSQTDIIKKQLACNDSQIRFIDTGFFLRRYLILNAERLFTKKEKARLYDGIRKLPSLSFELDKECELFIHNAVDIYRNRGNNRYKYKHLIYDLDNWILGYAPFPENRQTILKTACLLEMGVNDTNKFLLLRGLNPLNRRDPMEFAWQYLRDRQLKFSWDDLTIFQNLTQPSEKTVPSIEQSEEIRIAQRELSVTIRELQQYISEHNDYFCGESLRSLYSFRRLVYHVSGMLINCTDSEKDIGKLLRNYRYQSDDFLEKINISQLVKQLYDLLYTSLKEKKVLSQAIYAGLNTTAIDKELSSYKPTGYEEFMETGLAYIKKKAVGSLYTKITNIAKTLSAINTDSDSYDWHATTNRAGKKAPEYVDRKHVLILIISYLLMVFSKAGLKEKPLLKDNMDYTAADKNGSVARLCGHLDKLLSYEDILYNLQEIEKNQISIYLDQLVSNILNIFEFPGLYVDEADSMYLELIILSGKEYLTSL